MLVLSRTCEETIMIGDAVEVTVLDVRGDRVRLGIRAPAAVPVHRKEVYLALKEENARAAGADATAIERASQFFERRAPTAAPRRTDSQE
jgi:carbon storage regulator